MDRTDELAERVREVLGLIPDDLYGELLSYTTEHLVQQVDLPTGSGSSNRLLQNFTHNSAHLISQVSFNVGDVQVPLGRRYLHDALNRVTRITRGQPAAQGILRDEYIRDVTYDSLGRVNWYRDRHEQVGSTAKPSRRSAECTATASSSVITSSTTPTSPRPS